MVLLWWTQWDIQLWLILMGAQCMRCCLSVVKHDSQHCGSRVDSHSFVTARGDQISWPPGHHPQQGRIGGAYPRLDEVGEQCVLGFK